MKTLCKIEDYLLGEAGAIPNNPLLPLLIYRQAVEAHPEKLAGEFEEIFASNGWEPTWRHVIYDYDHYHSTAHEVIGVFQGRAKVRFGSTSGVEAWVEAGDVVVIPAGVGHMSLEQSDDFQAVGAYPTGQKPDILHANAAERAAAEKRIDKVPLPELDPVYGADGAMEDLW